ncbi:MAG: polysaccharide pyruvyl transferase family protein [Treponemataceae bacterium]
MKFGVLALDYDSQVVNSGRNEYSIVNIGSVVMRLMLEKLLVRMGIPQDEIIKINFYNLSSYDGEYVIVPINMHWMQDTGNKKLFTMSKKIIPIFLSISLNDTNIDEQQAIFLRRFEPIGCRDERTMNVLRKNNIDAYLFGCISCILEKRTVEPKDGKVFFADVPYAVKKFIPESMKKRIEFVEHEIPIEKLNGKTPEEYTRTIIKRYKNEASLVVTSRFHGAIIGWALGIPVIVTNEAYTFRFSWIKKLFPFYTNKDFKNID